MNVESRGTDKPDQQGTFQLLYLLLALDAALILLHVLYTYAVLPKDRLFEITRTGGYGELFQYAKEFWIALLFLVAFARTRQLGLFSWGLLFSYILLDDVLSLHEKAGNFLVAKLQLPSAFLYIRGQDHAELMFLCTIGVVFGGLIALAHFRGSRAARSVTVDMALLVLMLAAFGVALDVVHGSVPIAAVRTALDVGEDGGEMIVMSLVTWYAFHTMVGARLEAPQPWRRWRGALSTRVPAVIGRVISV